MAPLPLLGGSQGGGEQGLSLSEGTQGAQGVQGREADTDTPEPLSWIPRSRCASRRLRRSLGWGTRVVPTPPGVPKGGATISQSLLPSLCPALSPPCFPPSLPPRAACVTVSLLPCPLPGLCPHRVREVHSGPPGCWQTREDPPVGHSRWDRRGQGGQLCPPPSHPGVLGCPIPVVASRRAVPMP